MSIYTENDSQILLSNKDLPQSLLSRLWAFNIRDVSRFLDLATHEFQVLQRMLGINAQDLHQYIGDLRAKYPQIHAKNQAHESNLEPDWQVPPPGAYIDDREAYHDRVRKSLQEYNKTNGF